MSEPSATPDATPSPGWEAIWVRLSHAISALRDAEASNPRAAVFQLVLAVALIGATVHVLFLGSPENAVFWLAVPVGAAHIVAPWSNPSLPRRFRLLMMTMTWTFSVLLAACAIALAVHVIGSKYGYFEPKRHSVQFLRLDEGQVDATDPRAHIIRRVQRAASNTVDYQVGRAPILAFVTTINGVARVSAGEVNVSAELNARLANGHTLTLDAFPITAPNAWRTSNTLAGRYAGGPDAFARSLNAESLSVRGDTIVVPTTLTCLPAQILQDKGATFFVRILDRSRHAFVDSAPVRVDLREVEVARVVGCARAPTDHATLIPSAPAKSAAIIDIRRFDLATCVQHLRAPLSAFGRCTSGDLADLRGLGQLALA